MMEFEKRGVPTVSFTADTFVRDARRSAESFGFGGLPLAVVPLPFTNQPPDAVCGAVDECIDKVVAGLTQKVLPAQVRHEIAVVSDEWLAIKGESELEALEEMNRLFLEYGWGDGFPLRAPDERSIARMLKGTTRAADEIVAILEPGFGKATVEKIAVNALMAGCRSEHLPVVIAAVECLAEPQMYIRNKAMSTGPHAPLIWVNGPLAKRAGINAGICALGSGAPSYANSVIGRAVRLCMMNIGLTYAGVSDMDTIGSPTKYSMCVAENQQASPWTPYHVDHGYKPEASTVTVHFVYGICELHDFTNYEPARLVDVFATAATNAAQLSTGLWLIGRRADPRYGTEEKEHHTMSTPRYFVKRQQESSKPSPPEPSCWGWTYVFPPPPRTSAKSRGMKFTKIQPGDICLETNDAYPEWQRMEFFTSRSDHTHAFTYEGDGQMLQSTTPDGVQRTDLKDYLQGRLHVKVIPPQLSKPERHQAESTIPSRADGQAV